MNRGSRLTFCFFGLVLVGACGPKLVWVKPGVTELQIAQERYVCMRESGYTEKNPLAAIGETLQSTGAGLQGQPDPYRYSRLDADRSRQLFSACMQAMGYSLQPMPRSSD